MKSFGVTRRQYAKSRSREMNKGEAEIRDGIAEFENRISHLEMLHTPSFNQDEEPTIEPEPSGTIKGTPGLYDHIPKQIDQIKAHAIYLQNKLNEHIDASKKKKPQLKTLEIEEE